MWRCRFIVQTIMRYTHNIPTYIIVNRKKKQSVASVPSGKKIAK